MTTLKLPGMIDAHVHLREPGGTHKESVTSGTTAALAGGAVGILEMPNTNPATTDADSFTLKHKLYRSKSRCDFGLFLGSDGHNLLALTELGNRVAGLKLYLDNPYWSLSGNVGPDRVPSAFTLRVPSRFPELCPLPPATLRDCTSAT